MIQALSLGALRKWLVVPVVSLQAATSAALYLGLPEYPFSQVYALPVLIASAGYGPRGAIVASFSSLAWLTIFGYILPNAGLPGPIQLASNLAINLILGLWVSNYRFEQARNLEIIEKLREKNAQLHEKIMGLIEANGELMEENARVAGIRDQTMQFIGSIAHNLKTPITGIKGNAQLLLRSGSKLNLEKRTEVLQGIVHGANQLMNAVENLLDASLIEAGRLTLNRQEVSVGNLVGECARMLSGSAGEHVLELDVPPDTPSVYGDAQNLSQVLMNLIGNAMKYSERKTKIRVAVERAGEFVTVAVTDEGYGIAEQDLDRVFERYFRAEDAQARHIKGTGIGLSISREIVREHGGELSVRSKLGVGSTFVFTIPIYRPEALSGAASADGSGPPDKQHVA
jgi:signal transduction histidine kinase